MPNRTILETQSARARRGAFTLIELLVVIAIIGILVALLLPSVQYARQSASNAQCQSRLREIGMGLHHYHEANSRLPAGLITPEYWEYHRLILPYVEQNNLVEQHLRETAPGHNCFTDQKNHRTTGVPSKVLKLLHCPNDGRAPEVYVDSTWGNYALHNYFGVMGTTRFANDGVLYKNGKVTMGNVLDGLSNTITIGERPVVSNGLFGWWCCGAGRDATGEGDCLLSTEYGFSLGKDSAAHLYHFWSWHPQGANFYYLDGHVKFVRYNINTSIFNQLATRSRGEATGAFN